MILELLILGGVLGGASFVARKLHLRRKAKSEAPLQEPAKMRRPDTLEVSDVVLYLDREFWLAGCVELCEEDELVARLFRTPAAEPILWLAELGRAKEVVLFEHTDEVSAGRIGDEYPLGARSLRLTRRGRATMKTEGEQLPIVSANCDFALLGDGSGRRLLVLDETNGKRWTLLGECVGRELLDVLPGRETPRSAAFSTCSAL